MWFAPLFRGHSWRQFWVAIRRVPRDVRSWNVIVPFVLLLFAACYCSIFIVAFFVSLFEDKTYLVVAGIAFVLVGGITSIHIWMDHREARSTPAAVSPLVEQEVHREAFLLAMLLYRSSSERILEKEIPPQVQIVTRRYQRERLMQAGLWDDVPAEMKDLLLLPDGHWSERQKSDVNFCWEYFLVLRWVLRFDASLRPLDRGPRYDLAKVRELIDGFDYWKPGNALGPWDLRLARDNSYCHLWRLWTEAAARGLLVNIQPEQREEALRVKQQIDAPGPATDLLIDASTVSELSDSQLLTLLKLTRYRWQILHFLVEWLLSGEPVNGLRQLWVKEISPNA